MCKGGKEGCKYAKSTEDSPNSVEVEQHFKCETTTYAGRKRSKTEVKRYSNINYNTNYENGLQKVKNNGLHIHNAGSPDRISIIIGYGQLGRYFYELLDKVSTLVGDNTDANIQITKLEKENTTLFPIIINNPTTLTYGHGTHMTYYCIIDGFKFVYVYNHVRRNDTTFNIDNTSRDSTPIVKDGVVEPYYYKYIKNTIGNELKNSNA